MKYIIDASSHVPAYHQLYLLVREDIISGIYPTGSKLPSKRTVALDSNTSTVTVEHAYALLCAEDLVIKDTAANAVDDTVGSGVH